MSEEEKQKLNEGNDNKGKNAKDDEEEEPTCCQKYENCIIAICKGIYNCCVSFKNCFTKCCSTIIYPCKERCAKSCDDCDKSMHPYKDPKHNPYDEF